MLFLLTDNTILWIFSKGLLGKAFFQNSRTPKLYVHYKYIVIPLQPAEAG